MSEERLQRIEGKVDILVAGQIDLGVRVTKLEEQVADVNAQMAEVNGSQGELRAAIMQIAEGHAAHTRQIERGFQQLHAALDQRLHPLEYAVREHTAIFKRHGLT